jgi:hypothetical protein
MEDFDKTKQIQTFLSLTRRKKVKESTSLQGQIPESPWLNALRK